jgi:hypothetical protein
MTMKGALIAASVAGLFTGASSLAFAADEKEGDQVMCSGINGCKGHGLTKTTKEDCKAKGGKVAKAKEKK